MTILTFYDRATGEYLHQREGSLVDILSDIDPAYGLIEGARDSTTHYLADGMTHALRPKLAVPELTIAADGLETWTVGSIPAGSQASIVWWQDGDGAAVPTDSPDRIVFSGALDDDVLAWTTVLAGVYRVIIAPPFPYVRMQVEVKAVAP